MMNSTQRGKNIGILIVLYVLLTLVPTLVRSFLNIRDQSVLELLNLTTTTKTPCFFDKIESILFAYYTQSPAQGQMTFPEAASPKALGIFTLHDDIMIILVIICGFVSWFLFSTILKFRASGTWENPFRNAHSFALYLHRAATLEVFWTTLPALVIFAIAVPSFALLYSLEDVLSSHITLKCLGNQWYWNYEMNFCVGEGSAKRTETVKFDSYMLNTPEVQENQSFRLLDVDNGVYLPADAKIKVLVSSSDVLHSWTIPAFGIKLDACPGRLNATTLWLDRFGTFFGQCSEICGLNHGFMPIRVTSCSPEIFDASILTLQERLLTE